MRTLRFFAFGPAPLLRQQQRTCCTSSSVAAHAFVSRIRQPSSAISDDSIRSSFAASPLSTIHGGFQSRLYSKKGKKDVLLEERESEGGLLLEDEKTKKKKKVKEQVDENADAAVPVNNVVSEDTKSKKKKSKNKQVKPKQDEVVELKQDEVVELKQDEASGTLQTEESEVAQNGASSAEKIITEVKGKKKSRSKSKPKESEDELPQELDEPDESASVIEDVLAEEFEEHLDDDDFWEDDFEPEAELNDGGDGGGIVLGEAAWGKVALELAEKVVADFNGALEIFAFKVSKDTGIIRVRVDKLSDKYGSPTMDEIQHFSSSFTKLLDKAGEAKTIPDDYALEVSSPGAERVVRIPKDLDRFKELPMYVRYIESSGEESPAPEKDGVLQLESVDMEVGSAKWKLADVRLNRDLAGKGRGLTRKQRDWRVDLPFESIQLVRLYIDL